MFAALFVDFRESPPVIWSDRVCRTVLGKGLTLAGDARSQRQTGDEARETQSALRQLTAIGIDAGPRELFRWASEEAYKRWPERLRSFGRNRGWQRLLARSRHSSTSNHPLKVLESTLRRRAPYWGAGRRRPAGTRMVAARLT